MAEVQQQRVPFVPDQQSGYDSLGGAGQFAHNVVIDKTGTVRRRPGLVAHPLAAEYTNPGVPIAGLYCTSDSRVYGGSGNIPGNLNVFELKTNQPAVNFTASPEVNVTATTRPIFTETEALVVLASGRTTVKIGLFDNTLSHLEGGVPSGTHIIANSLRLLTNDIKVDKTKVAFSAPAQSTSILGHEQWGDQQTALGTSGFFSAEARPDPVVAIAENSNEVWVFGSTNVQTFVPDNTFFFAPVTTREFGCSAAYSVIKDDQSFAWLDDRRRFIHSDGRAVSILSSPLQGTLDQLSRVDDCFGYRVLSGSTDVLVWQFPSDGRAFAYQREGGWSTWTLAVTAHTGVVGTNEQIVGLEDGRIGAFDSTATTDFGDPILGEILTGRIDRGTSNRKLCRALLISIRRGQVVGPRVAAAEISYRDDEGVFSSPISIDLGNSPDRHTVVSLRSLGVYRSRQWRFRFTGPEDIALGAVTEEFEILEH